MQGGSQRLRGGGQPLQVIAELCVKSLFDNFPFPPEDNIDLSQGTAPTGAADMESNPDMQSNSDQRSELTTGLSCLFSFSVKSLPENLLFPFDNIDLSAT